MFSLFTGKGVTGDRFAVNGLVIFTRGGMTVCPMLISMTGTALRFTGEEYSCCGCWDLWSYDGVGVVLIYNFYSLELKEEQDRRTKPPVWAAIVVLLLLLLMLLSTNEQAVKLMELNWLNPFEISLTCVTCGCCCCCDCSALSMNSKLEKFRCDYACYWPCTDGSSSRCCYNDSCLTKEGHFETVLSPSLASRMLVKEEGGELMKKLPLNF